MQLLKREDSRVDLGIDGKKDANELSGIIKWRLMADRKGNWRNLRETVLHLGCKAVFIYLFIYCFCFQKFPEDCNIFHCHTVDFMSDPRNEKSLK